MVDITVTQTEGSSYRVVVEEAGGRTAHDVTASADTIARYAPGVSAERLIDASFRFLLEHEPKESILTRFDLTVIERYFPDYPKAIRQALDVN